MNLNSGNLVVSLDDKKKEDFENSQNSSFKIIDVKTGTLCLFPASLFHYTIPFKSDEDRIVLAFDVIANWYSILDGSGKWDRTTDLGLMSPAL